MATKKNAKKEIIKKPVTPDVICDVLNGKYGAEPGKERNDALRADGINPSIVTKHLNELEKLAEQMKPLFDAAGEYAGCLMMLLD